MADMQTAVEVLARALPRVTMDASRVSAAALLAEIAPLIRAEEREQCAKVADREAKDGGSRDEYDQGWCRGASVVAAAIRQRGNE